MILKEKIQFDMKDALKSQNALRLSTLRMLVAAITNKEIELRKKNFGLADAEVLDVIKSESKKRKDSIAEFKRGGRADLVEKESEELAILSEYLPPELSDDETRRAIDDAIREADASGIADFGKAMKAAMGILKGRASGDRVAEMLRKKLSGE